MNISQLWLYLFFLYTDITHFIIGLCMTETILITGASGFLGKRIMRFLQRTTDAYLITTSRQQESYPNHLVRDLATMESDVTDNVDTIIHCAGVHEKKGRTLAQYQSSNVDNTLRLAQLALESGVKRFIYLSTVTVHGSITDQNEVITEKSNIEPQTPYAQSKHEAEIALKKKFEQTDVNLIILRLSQVYHIDIHNQFGDYIQMVRTMSSLPFKNIHNRRSLLALCNFETGLSAVLHQPNIRNEIFILSDVAAISTSTMMTGIAIAAEKPVKLYYLPKVIAYLGLSLTQRSALYDNLWRDYQVSSHYAQTVLQWQPTQDYVANLSN